MKKVVVILQLLISVLSFSGFYDIYLSNLSKSSNYISAKSNLSSADLEQRKIDEFFVPYISLGSGAKSIKFDKNGLGDLSPVINMNFIEINGFNASLNIPFEVSGDSSWKVKLQPISLNITRNNFFDENSQKKMKTNAEYLDAIFAIEQVKNNVFIDTVNGIFNAYINEKKLKLLNEELKMIEEHIENENNQEKLRQLKKEMLLKRKQIRNCETISRNSEKLEVNEGLYKETLDTIIGILTKFDAEFNYKSRLDVKAAQLRLKVSDERASNWYYPYLPEVGMNFSIDDLSEPTWSLMFNFNYQIFDKGERKIRVQERLDNSENLKYEEFINGIEKSIEKIRNTIADSEIDLEIAQLELEETRSELEKKERLFKLGFETEFDMMKASQKLDYSELEIQQSKISLYMEKLNLLQISGVSFFN